MFWWQEKGKLEVFIKSKRYVVPTDDFIKYLESEIAKCFMDEKFYTIGYTTRKYYELEDVVNNNSNELNDYLIYLKIQKQTYYNVLHFILCNMKNTIKIQVYDDGAVRLYQYDEVRSIWWDTPSCYTHPLNLYILDRLIEFVKQYK